MEAEIKNKNANDTDFMKQYLKDVYTLEKELYCSQQAKNETANILSRLGHSQNIPLNGKKRDSYIASAIIWGVVGALLGAFIGLFAGGLISVIVGMIANIFADKETAMKVSYIAVIAIGAVGGFCYFFSDAKSKAEKDNSDFHASLRRIKEDEERVEKEKALIPTYQNNEKLYSQNISSCQSALEKLYGLDIIFPKYRNFVAVSQIYEYYTSGRCTELEGHEGAYNVFESELRQNIIISQLNNVLNQLEQIKQNQYMIYAAVCEANSHLSNIESNIEAINYNTAVIAENTSICARY